jgi:hypothetical protein
MFNITCLASNLFGVGAFDVVSQRCAQSFSGNFFIDGPLFEFGRHGWREKDRNETSCILVAQKKMLYLFAIDMILYKRVERRRCSFRKKCGSHRFD